ncbi:MAG: hypothetical protein K1000chlam3_00338 [Chlamydiae bacterium]|nr:hypothetical protein [Chlamydiota bacterium]
MKITSYSGCLLNKTNSSEIQKNNSYIKSALKFPINRIVFAAVTAFAIMETILFTTATVVFSPLYLISNNHFNSIKNEAVDSAMTAALAAKRFFGCGTITNEENSLSNPKKLEKNDSQSTTQPTTTWEKGLQFLKNRVSDLTHVAVKHPNTTLVALVAVGVFSAWYFGAFDVLFSNSSDLSNTSKLEQGLDTTIVNKKIDQVTSNITSSIPMGNSKFTSLDNTKKTNISGLIDIAKKPPAPDYNYIASKANSIGTSLENMKPAVCPKLTLVQEENVNMLVNFNTVKNLEEVNRQIRVNNFMNNLPRDSGIALSSEELRNRIKEDLFG